MRALLAGLLAVLVLAATACGGAAGGDGPVRFLVFGDPEELAAYRALATAYEKQAGGDARVRLVEASDRSDLIARLSTSIAGGSPPEVFLLNYRFYGQFAAKNAIEPLDARLRTSTSVKLSDLYPAPTEAFRWRGRQMCLPTNVSSLAVYYNRDLFRKHKVAEPRSDWRWNDMLAAAQALTRDPAGNVIKGSEPEAGAVRPAVYGLGIEPSLIRIAPFVWSNGGELVDDVRRPTRLTLDTPQAREALRNFFDLNLAYGVVPPDEEVEAQDDESRFANGGLAMLLSSRRSTTTFRTIKNFTWDVAPLPTYGKAAGILHSDAYCITRAAKAKDAAWRFVEFAIGSEGQRILAGTGRTVPSNVQVSRSRAFLEPAKPPAHAQVFLDAVPTVRRVPTISTWPEIEDVTGGILENALYRGDPLDQVLRDIDQKTRPLFARGETP
jgi:multiple sugar transport system substrate-binding protein